MKKVPVILLSFILIILSFCFVSCARAERYEDALRVGTLSLPKNLNPYSSTASSSTFFVELFYDTLLGTDAVPVGYEENPTSFEFADGSKYEPIDNSENPLLLTSNLVDVSGALKKRDGSEYGYEYFDPNEEEWQKQLAAKAIVEGKDEEEKPLQETHEQFLERAEEAVPKQNWLRFTFKVNHDYTWNDGVAFTAEDIVFTFDYIIKYRGQLGSFAYFLSDYYQSYATSDDDFVLELASNNYTALKTIGTALVIIPKHIWRDIKNPSNEKNLSAVGTGPYKLESGDYVADNSITVTYRKDYAESLKKAEFSDEPINHISVQLMSNEDVLINAMQQGDVDLMLDSVTPAKAYAIASSGNYPNVKTSAVRNDFVTTLLFNVGNYGAFGKNGKYKDFSEQIRKAISLCIDQQVLIDETLHGMGVKVGDGLVQDYYEHAYKDENGHYVYHRTNIEEANKLLDQTIYKMTNGSRGITIVAYAMTTNESIVRSIATQLKQIGITLEYEQATSTYSEVIKQSNHASFDCIINTVTFTADKLLMFDARYGVYDDGSPRVWNYSGIIDEKLSALMKEMEKTADTEKQYKLCGEVQKYIADLAIEIPLFAVDTITLYSEQKFVGWIEAQGSSIWNGYSIKYLKSKEVRN